MIGVDNIVYVDVSRRTRYMRAFRWPLTAWRFHRCGVSWATAFRMTHLTVWYDFKLRKA